MSDTYLDQAQRLADLLVFVKVVEQGSFTRSALVLGLSKSAVTKQVQRLERGMGVTLLHRTTRKLSVTEAGQLLFAHAEAMVRSVGAASDAMAGLTHHPAGRLRMTAPVTYGRHVLAPLLPAFHKRHPQVQIELLLVDRHVDLWEEGMDLAVRLTDAPPAHLAGRPLHDCAFVLCATPGFLRKHRVRHPADLAGVPCVPFEAGPARATCSWRFSQPGQAPVAVQVSGPVAVNSSDVVRELALAGMGIGLLPAFVVANDLARGTLKAILPAWRPQGAFGPTAWALWQPQRAMPPKLRVMVDFLVASLEAPAQAPDWR